MDRDARYDDADEFRRELDGFVGARASDMKGELSALLTRLFPGQEARQAQWERAATSVRVPKHTMPPPAPVPIASTSMIEVADPSEPDQEAAAPISSDEPKVESKPKVETTASKVASPKGSASASASLNATDKPSALARARPRSSRLGT